MIHKKIILLNVSYFFWGLILAILFCSLFQSSEWFKIDFASILDLIVTIALAIYVTYFLGGLLNRSTKSIEIRLEGIKKIEDQVDKLFEYFSKILIHNNQNTVDKELLDNTKNLFSNMFEIQEIFIQDATSNRANLLDTLTEIKSSTEKLWELITGEGFGSKVVNYPEENLSQIYIYKHEIRVNIYRCKLLIIS